MKKLGLILVLVMSFETAMANAISDANSRVLLKPAQRIFAYAVKAQFAPGCTKGFDITKEQDQSLNELALINNCNYQFSSDSPKVQGLINDMNTKATELYDALIRLNLMSQSQLAQMVKISRSLDPKKFELRIEVLQAKGADQGPEFTQGIQCNSTLFTGAVWSPNMADLKCSTFE